MTTENALLKHHQNTELAALAEMPNRVLGIASDTLRLIIKLEDGTVVKFKSGDAPSTHAASHNFGGTDALAGQSIAGLRAVDSPTFVAVTAKLNVHSGNEATIANGYSAVAGGLWINYGGATQAITEYRFGSGRSDSAYGALKGLSFIKSGGTNQQILLADGTTDPKTRGVESTGLYAWPSPCISIASPTTFTVTAVSGQVVDTTTTPGVQVVTPVAYLGATGITATYLAVSPTTYVMVSAAGALVQQTTIPTAQQRRENIFLGILVHSAFTAITAIDVQPDICTNPISQMRELWGAIRYVNDGVIPYPNGANLSINISGGHFHGLGLNWAANTRDPMIRNVGPYVAPNFKYRLRAGGTTSIVSAVDPTHWDSAGVLTALAGGVNTSTNQRINISPAGEIVIQYGQTVYSSLNDAVASSSTETFVTAPGVAENLQLIGTLSVRKGATNLSLLTDAKFLTASKFGELSSGSAGATTATFQSIYDNSIVPQITTNTTNGALTIKAPTGGDDSLNQIVVMSGASAELFRANALGQVFATSYTLTGVVSSALAKFDSDGDLIPAVGSEIVKFGYTEINATNATLKLSCAPTTGQAAIQFGKGSTGTDYRIILDWREATDYLAFRSYHTDGTYLYSRLLIPRLSTQPISVNYGLDVSTGALKIGGVDTISAARAFTGTDITLSGAISQGANVRLTSGGKGQFSALSVQGITANALVRVDGSGNQIASGVSDDGSNIRASRTFIGTKLLAAFGASDSLGFGSQTAWLDAEPTTTKGWVAQLGTANTLDFWNFAGGVWNASPTMWLDPSGFVLGYGKALFQGVTERISGGGAITGTSLKSTGLSSDVGKSVVVGASGLLVADNARGAMISFASIPSASITATVPYTTTSPDVGYVGSFVIPTNTLTAHRVIEIEGGFRASGAEVVCTLSIGIGAGGVVFNVPVITAGAYVRFSIQLGVSTVGSGGTASIVGLTTTGTGDDRTFGVASVAVDTTAVNTLAITLSGTGTFSISSRTLTIRG